MRDVYSDPFCNIVVFDRAVREQVGSDHRAGSVRCWQKQLSIPLEYEESSRFTFKDPALRCQFIELCIKLAS